MTTKEAFKVVIAKSDCHQRTGLSHPTITKYRNIVNGKSALGITINKMEDIILKYGGKKIVQEKWEI